MHVFLIGTCSNISQSAVLAFTSPSLLTSNQIPDSLGSVVSLTFNILVSGSIIDIFCDIFFFCTVYSVLHFFFKSPELASKKICH